jgi:chromosome partitioning protein
MEAIKSTDMELLDIMPSNIDLVGAEVELVPLMARETMLKRALEDIKSLYDYIFWIAHPRWG